MGLIQEVSGFFNFLSLLFDLLPVAVKTLIVTSFGGMIYIAVLKSIRS